MAAHIRYVYPLDNSWAIKHPEGQRISHRYDLKVDAIDRAKRIIANLGGGYVLVQDQGEHHRITVTPLYG